LQGSDFSFGQCIVKMFLPELGEMIFCAGIVFEKEPRNYFQILRTKIRGCGLPKAIYSEASRRHKDEY
jgi:hypothetical protein